MVRLHALVFGSYTHGKLQGQTNPKSRNGLIVHGEDQKDCIKKLKNETNGAFYQIQKFDEVAA